MNVNIGYDDAIVLIHNEQLKIVTIQFDELPHPLELRLLRDKDCPTVAFCMQKQPS